MCFWKPQTSWYLIYFHSGHVSTLSNFFYLDLSTWWYAGWKAVFAVKSSTLFRSTSWSLVMTHLHSLNFIHWGTSICIFFWVAGFLVFVITEYFSWIFCHWCGQGPGLICRIFIYSINECVNVSPISRIRFRFQLELAVKIKIRSWQLHHFLFQSTWCLVIKNSVTNPSAT